ncbi:hypothetical protein DFJ73DRAFT_805909 [Zopfochytrium polystomum]|nr:hypothetical protein DFJ73DRAFT_805909 [Zopfochytrium polystomum]
MAVAKVVVVLAFVAVILTIATDTAKIPHLKPRLRTPPLQRRHQPPPVHLHAPHRERARNVAHEAPVPRRRRQGRRRRHSCFRVILRDRRRRCLQRTVRRPGVVAAAGIAPDGPVVGRETAVTALP